MTAKFPANSTSILLLGGRVPACLEWARLLYELGYVIHMADSVSPTLTKYSNRVTQSHLLSAPNSSQWKQQLKNIVIKYNIELIIPTCEEVFYLANACLTDDLLRQKSWVADFTQLMQLHDKYSFSHLVDSLNCKDRHSVKTPITINIDKNLKSEALLALLYQLFPVLSHYLAKSQSALTHQQTEEIVKTRSNWVLKPRLSRFATHTITNPTLAQLLAALFNKSFSTDDALDLLTNLKSRSFVLPKISNSWVAQQYIKGQEFASYSLAQDGNLMAHTCYYANCRTSTNNKYDAKQTGASLDFKCVHFSQIVDFVTLFTQQTKYTGQLGFDFIQDDMGQFWVLECNPRATSGIHLLATDNQFITKLYGLSSLINKTHAAYIQVKDEHYSLKFAILYELIKHPKNYQTIINTLRSSEDVIHHPDDLKPLLGQFTASAQLLWQAWRHDMSVLEMSTFDIAWDKEVIA